jgi:teichoic acid transport system ATP-binding protein
MYSSDVKRALGTMGFSVQNQAFTAINNLSYNFEKGEVTAILGRNGSGKSTLLKLITGVTHPNSGTIVTRGRISAMLELRSGFDNELTGEENIYYKALTMGISQSDIEHVKDEIIAFADIGVHINQPFRTYSSGMKARLGFAVAANVSPDILIVDEALAVGDDIFKMKCIAKMNEFRQGGKTILFVSHSLATVKAFCTRAIWLNNGCLMAEGAMGDVVVEYAEFLKMERANARLKAIEMSEEEDPVLARSDVLIGRNFKLLNSEGRPAGDNLHFGKSWSCTFHYRVKKSVSKLTAAVTIENAEGIEVFSSDKQAHILDKEIGLHAAQIGFSELRLIPGAYTFTLELWDIASSLRVFVIRRFPFTVMQTEYVGTGIIGLRHCVRQIKPEEVPDAAVP